MADISTALDASKDAMEQLIIAGERTRFDEACRQTASRGEQTRTTIFGAVPVEDYVRFMEFHTRHHGKQMADD